MVGQEKARASSSSEDDHPAGRDCNITSREDDPSQFCDVASQLVKFEGQHIRYLVDDNDIQWWRGRDVAAAMGYKSTPHAISAHVPQKYKKTGSEIRLGDVHTLIDKYEATAVYLNESGLYTLMYSSQLPEATRFREWIMEDVLPAIRRHGTYSTQAKLELEREKTKQMRLKMQDDERMMEHERMLVKELTLKKEIEEAKTRNLAAVPDVTHWHYTDCKERDRDIGYKNSFALTKNFLACGQYNVGMGRGMTERRTFDRDMAGWIKPMVLSQFDAKAVEVALLDAGVETGRDGLMLLNLARLGGPATRKSRKRAAF